jgi:GT2 family glycosyltransferase
MHLLRDCLDSLRGQTFRDFECILIDNASTDESVEFVRKHYPEVRIIQNQKNLGYGGGNNVGITASSGKYIALLNNDTKADANWLQRLVEAIEEDEKIGMCASKILNYYNPETIDNTGLLLYKDGIARGRGRLEKDVGQYASSEEVFFPSGCAGLYKREMLDGIGLFDEDFFLYLDDVDIGMRGRLAGWKCIYVPDAVVYHKYSATTEPYSSLKAYLVERNRIWIVMKYFPLRMMIVSLFYTLLRYVLQGYGALRKKGASSHLVRSESVFTILGIILKAYISALYKSGRMLRKRRQVMSIKKVTNREISQWFRVFGMGAKEIALKE